VSLLRRRWLFAIAVLAACHPGVAVQPTQEHLLTETRDTPESKFAEFDEKIDGLEHVVIELDRDPSRLEWMLKLAKVYSEKANYARTLADSLTKPIAEAQTAGDEETQRAEYEKIARVSSIRSRRVLEAVVSDPRNSAFEDMDEALYLFATESTILGYDQWARMAHARLAYDYPDSQYASSAYLYLANSFYGEHRFDEANEAYEKIAGFEDESLHAYALYRLGCGHLHVHGEDNAQYRDSLRYFAEAIRATSEPGRARSASEAMQLRRLARLALVQPYSRIGPAADAWSIFVELGLGPGPGDDETRQMMELLAEEYAELDEWDESTAVYESLQNRFEAAADFCRWQRAIIENQRHGGNKSRLKAAERIYAEKQCTDDAGDEAPSPPQRSSIDASCEIPEVPPEPKPVADNGPRKKLNTAEIKAGIETIRTDANRCFTGAGTPATVGIQLIVEGATGHVVEAEAVDDARGTAIGACVAEHVLRIEYPSFQAERMAFTYRFRRPE
jgi:TolA-binding protein